MNKELSKIIEYTTREELLYKKLQEIDNGETICAYKKVMYINNQESSSYEGICTLTAVENFERNTSLSNTTEISMFKTSVEDYFIKNTPNTCEFFNELENLEIKNPYTYISKNNDWGLYIYNNSSWSLLNVNNEELPKGVFFSYIGSGLDNTRYDLEELLEILKKRDDIIFEDGQDKILSIPDYNSDRNRHSYLEFLWMPNTENFKDVKKIKDSYSRCQYIIKNIFGLNEIKNIPNDDCYEDDDFCNI